MKETIKLYGMSVGDPDVGIFPIEFSFDTGLIELTDEDRYYLINTIIRDIWELHDNGKVKFNFSDEDDNIFLHTMTYDRSREILKQTKKYYDTRVDLK